MKKQNNYPPILRNPYFHLLFSSLHCHQP